MTDNPPPCRCVTGNLTRQRDEARSDVTDLAWEIETKWRPQLEAARAENERLRTAITLYAEAVTGDGGASFDERMAAFQGLFGEVRQDWRAMLPPHMGSPRCRCALRPALRSARA